MDSSITDEFRNERHMIATDDTIGWVVTCKNPFKTEDVLSEDHLIKNIKFLSTRQDKF